MRFKSVRIENFRAIQLFEAEDLEQLVVISGPNGCGKSCVFDAVRLLKSTYGGYQPNEHSQWLNEFQIDQSSPNRALTKTLRDRAEPAHIRAVLTLASDEEKFIRENSPALSLTRAWSTILGRQMEDLAGFSPEGLALQNPGHVRSVEAMSEQIQEEVRSALSQDNNYQLELTITTDGKIESTRSPVAELVFQTYEPRFLGILDYHSASRTYSREGLFGGLNLNPRSHAMNRRGTALYGAAQKYQGVRTEIVNSYLQALVAKDAGSDATALVNDMSMALTELFRTFFPDKSFAGARPQRDGTVELPVVLASGQTHDIDELSSGEKEILFGYLRLRSDTPRHSVILLDEPELHLNPRLIAGLPDFYYKHLCVPQDNQLWMVTHSDALLRHAVANPRFTVLHMTSAQTSQPGTSQATRVSEDSLDAAVLELVGDVSSYRPLGKVVVLEGGGQSEFDRTMISRLFPGYAARVNLISGGSKGRVNDIYRTLAAASKDDAGGRFFAIVDRDFDGDDESSLVDARVLKWDVYHLENYLLHPQYLAAAIGSLSVKGVGPSEEEISEVLRDCAQAALYPLVGARLAAQVNQEIVAAVSIKAAPNSITPGKDLAPSLNSTYERLNELRSALHDLESREAALRSVFETHLADGSYLKAFPGRELLKALLSKLNVGVKYERFVALIINEMVHDGYAPPGMETVLKSILEH